MHSTILQSQTCHQVNSKNEDAICFSPFFVERKSVVSVYKACEAFAFTNKLKEKHKSLSAQFKKRIERLVFAT